MATIQGIYVALFGRPADPAGLAFFNEATNNGADLTAIGDLASTAEYQTRFTGMTNEEIVNSIYQSLFERDGEADGIAFFVAELEAGRLNINNIAIAILDGAQGDDLLTVNAKIAAADIFTAHLDLQIEVDAYAGAFAASVGRDFLNTVDREDPGTEDEADTAILRLFDQGQQPGGGIGGGGTPATFTIVDGELGIVFGGSATGTVGLGIDEDGDLTGTREGQTATFPEGSIYAEEGVDLSDLSEDIVLADNLHVTITAEEADGFSISGTGSVCVTGSEGDQSIIVSATEGNHIEGGLGADAIDITDAAGEDDIVVNGVSQELFDAVDAAQDVADAADDALSAAQQTLDELEDTHQALVEADDEADALVTDRGALQDAYDAALADDTSADAAVDDAEADVEAAETAVGAAEADVDTAQDAVNAANDKLDNGDIIAIKIGISLAFITLGDSDAHRASVTNYINGLDIPAGAKTALIDALPDGNFFAPGHLQQYTSDVNTVISNYKSGLASDLSDAQDVLAGAQQDLTDEQGALTDAQEHAGDTQTALDDATIALNDHISEHGSTADLIADAAATQDALDAYDIEHEAKAEAVESAEGDAEAAQGALEAANTALDEATHDSMVGTEDHVTGFVVGTDTLHLPSTDVVEDISELNFTYNETGYVLNVVDGIATLTLANPEEGEDPVVVPSGEALADALAYLSNDRVVEDGQTIAFYFNADDDGQADDLYVFQGAPGAADIGVVLIGVEGVTDVRQLFNEVVPV